MTQHRWSGWPGAWCLDCGQEDQMEHCVADHDVALYCVHGHALCTKHPMPVCAVHVNGPCQHPGEGLADPYRLADERRALLALLAARRISIHMARIRARAGLPSAGFTYYALDLFRSQLGDDGFM